MIEDLELKYIPFPFHIKYLKVILTIFSNYFSSEVCTDFLQVDTNKFCEVFSLKISPVKSASQKYYCRIFLDILIMLILPIWGHIQFIKNMYKWLKLRFFSKN